MTQSCVHHGRWVSTAVLSCQVDWYNLFFLILFFKLKHFDISFVIHEAWEFSCSDPFNFFSIVFYGLFGKPVLFMAKSIVLEHLVTEHIIYIIHILVVHYPELHIRYLN